MAGIIEVKDQGVLRIYDADNSNYVDIVVPSTVSSNRTITLPDASFTVPTADTVGGITEFDMHRLTSSITADTDPITSNIERVDDATFSKIGTGVSQSSGVWSFPSTGLWQVGFSGQAYPAANDNITLSIYATANNGTAWDQVAQSNFGNGSSRTQGRHTNFSLVNCTDTSNVKVKFTAGSFASSTSELNGNTDMNFTCLFFMRVGDSQ